MGVNFNVSRLGLSLEATFPVAYTCWAGDGEESERSDIPRIRYNVSRVKGHPGERVQGMPRGM